MLLYFAKWANPSARSFQIWTISLPRDFRFLIPQSGCKTPLSSLMHDTTFERGTPSISITLRARQLGFDTSPKLPYSNYAFHAVTAFGIYIHPFDVLSSPKLTADIQVFWHMCPPHKKLATPVTAQNGNPDSEGLHGVRKSLEMASAIGSLQALSAPFLRLLLVNMTSIIDITFLTDLEWRVSDSLTQVLKRKHPRWRFRNTKLAFLAARLPETMQLVLRI